MKVFLRCPSFPTPMFHIGIDDRCKRVWYADTLLYLDACSDEQFLLAVGIVKPGKIMVLEEEANWRVSVHRIYVL